MASISGICSSSSTFMPDGFFPGKLSAHSQLLSFRNESVSLQSSAGSRCCDLRNSSHVLHSIARDISASLAPLNEGLPTQLSGTKEGGGAVLEKDPLALWHRYVDWLYQHKELGLFLDVSRVGFTDDFVYAMEPRFQKAVKDMEALEKGAIANPDEGRMVGHYWLRSPQRAPSSFLSLQIQNTLESIVKFANDVVSGKVSLLSAHSLTLWSL